jgi:uncharacterized protein YqjF (DUF2071 family)
MTIISRFQTPEQINGRLLLRLVLFLGSDPGRGIDTHALDKRMAPMSDAVCSIAAKTEPTASNGAAKRWTWSQHWINLLFLHWRVAADALMPHIPDGLEIDEHDGSGWVSLVLFRLKVRPRWLPFVPGFSTLNELNLRTYVRHRDQPGICFLSIHADNRWAIRIARRLTPLPYHEARIRYRQSPEEFSFECQNLAVPQRRLALDFRPAGEPRLAQESSRDEWLLERYRLFIAGARQELQVAEVVHPRWLFQEVESTIVANTIASPFGLDLSRPPDAVHFSPGLVTRFGAFGALVKG